MADFEIWRTIYEYPNYEFSNLGRVRNTITNVIVKGSEDQDGYLRMDIRDKDNKKHKIGIHKLIAIAFYGNKDGYIVNHIDCNKQNNMITNLEWVTPEYNSTLASKEKLYKTKAVKIVETGEIFDSIRECARVLKVNPTSISKALSEGITIADVHIEYTDTPKKEREDFLSDEQKKALVKMKNGCILNGGTGSGKSRTGLYYYFKKNGGCRTVDKFEKMTTLQPLYIITTAMKRDKEEWELELANYCLSTNPDLCNVKIFIDSWNNIQHYTNISDAFFMFDEDRVTGTGAWAKAFLKIAKVNDWIILSATPADRWIDFMTVFIANGFYKNQREFKDEHVEYNRFVHFPSIKKYHNTGRLMRLRKKIVVEMDSSRKINLHHIDKYCDYDRTSYKQLFRDRIDPYSEDQEPIKNITSLCYTARRLVNENPFRLEAMIDILKEHREVIIFYNFDYELYYIKNFLEEINYKYAEWNGHKHEDIPEGLEWAYLVQYNAGAEGWNCTRTNAMIFYSENYSYKMMLQASGRINRMNTPYTDLYYYHLKTRCSIDVAISKALMNKKKFNEAKFVGDYFEIQ